MADDIKFVSVSFIKMKEREAKPVPGYFIHADDNGNPIMTDPVHIPIKQNVNERNKTWKGYIKVEKAGMHYFRIDGDDVLTLKIPHAKVDITTGGGSLTTQTAQANLERGFHYCELTYNNKAYKPEAKSYEGCIAIMSTTEMPPEGILDPQECPNLEKAKEALETVLGMEEAPYTYDRYVKHPGSLDSSNYVTIGGHDFYKNKQYRSCDKPAWWVE